MYSTWNRTLKRRKPLTCNMHQIPIDPKAQTLFLHLRAPQKRRRSGPNFWGSFGNRLCRKRVYSSARSANCDEKYHELWGAKCRAWGLRSNFSNCIKFLGFPCFNVPCLIYALAVPCLRCWAPRVGLAGFLEMLCL